MAMGGRVAEELIFGPDNVTSGASSDIQQVSRIARAMVTQFGMSEKLGNIDYANRQDTYLGPQQGGLSAGPDTQEVIDAEVRKLVDEGYETAKRILTEKSEDLKNLAEGLLEYETLTGSEITKVIAGEPLRRGSDEDDADSGGSAPSVASIPKIKKKTMFSGGPPEKEAPGPNQERT